MITPIYVKLTHKTNQYKGNQCVIDIMGNFPSNMLEEKASFDGIPMLFMEVGKIALAVACWLFALFPEGVCLFVSLVVWLV